MSSTTDDAAMASTTATETEATTTCRYSSKPCSLPRAVKKTGDLHSFCEFHRSMANRNQRRCEQKRRTQRQLEKAMQRRTVQALHAFDAKPNYSKPLKRRRARAQSSPTAVDEVSAVPLMIPQRVEATKTLDPIPFQSVVEEDRSLEPFTYPVSLHDEDLECLLMTVVDATLAVTLDASANVALDGLYVFSV